jgi:alpha,alpha-trehalase
MIRTTFWNNLTRRLDGDGLEIICADPKNRASNQNPRIYVPDREPEMFEYYKRLAANRSHLNLEVEKLPKDFTPEYVKSLNDRPGILALAMEKTKKPDSTLDLKGIPFVVPGARFNEVRYRLSCRARDRVNARPFVLALQLGQLLHLARSPCRQ